jgi:hypothetical protein
MQHYCRAKATAYSTCNVASLSLLTCRAERSATGRKANRLSLLNAFRKCASPETLLKNSRTLRILPDWQESKAEKRFENNYSGPLEKELYYLTSHPQSAD